MIRRSPLLSAPVRITALLLVLVNVLVYFGWQRGDERKVEGVQNGVGIKA